jgi:hypothetical protein
MTKFKVKYKDIRSSLDTLDVVLCAGTGFLSKFIKISGPWSHVVQVYRIPEHDLLLGWESTEMDGASGVRIVDLCGVIRRYLNQDGRIAIRQISGSRGQEFYTKLRDFRRRVEGTPYPANKLEVARAYLDKFGWANEDDLSEIFCSELAFETFEAVDWVLPGTGAGRTPTDFSEEAEDEPVRLTNASWRPQVEVIGL